MKEVALVALGGAIGSVSRYLVVVGLGTKSLWSLPLPTIAVNVIGCFAIGLVHGFASSREWFDPNTTLFLTTGLLGGFTTFSAFGYEAVQLGLNLGPTRTLAYLGVHILLGIPAAWLGFAVSR